MKLHIAAMGGLYKIENIILVENVKNRYTLMTIKKPIKGNGYLFQSPVDFLTNAITNYYFLIPRMTM